MALVGGAATPALAGGGTVGDPQPELAQFRVGSTGGNGTGAVLPNGNLVLATPSKSGTTIAVCVLHPGGRSCASTATLSANKAGGQDTFYGTVEVIASGGSDVEVVALDCCNIGPDGAVIFDSTDGGLTFTGLKKAGTIASIGAATYAGGSIVVGSFSQGGLQVQALAPDPSTPQMSFAVPIPGTDGDTSLTTYHGGVLVASDNLKNTYVEYATAGSGLNTSGSYVRVGTFGNELVTAVSGSALLTDPGGSLTGGERLRFFNGTSFGPPHKVPDAKLGDDGYFALQQVGATVHVFFLGRRNGYDVFEETTTDGVHWSALHQFGAAIGSSSLVPVLGPTGAGVLYATAGFPLLAQPILNVQGVHVALAATRVKVGHATVLRGTASPHLVSQGVTLEQLHGGRWYGVRSTKEHANGTFTFGVAGATATYRAVVNERPGYFQFGYSNAATLTALP
ncbi:MAG TPA: hypothetical protein VGZ03_02130 [Acidimicrobiales bacterium]|nr:hypothetical protein [Acidimicrobiales bacterium]